LETVTRLKNYGWKTTLALTHALLDHGATNDSLQAGDEIHVQVLETSILGEVHEEQ